MISVYLLLPNLPDFVLNNVRYFVPTDELVQCVIIDSCVKAASVL